jgi:photosystem II stability/assembly factor-like uncharacterized protein
MKIARYTLPVSVFLLIALAAVAPAQEKVWTSHGPTGAGWVNALALDPQDPSTVWAGCSGSDGGNLFRSADAGLSWSPGTGPSGLPSVDAFAIDPGNSSKLYAVGPPDPARVGLSAVYRSSDGGEHWTSSDVPAGSVHALAIDPGSPNRIWAATSGGLYLSDDGAQSWRNSPALAQEIYCLLFDGKRPGTLYAGSYFDVDPSDPWDGGGPYGGSVFVSRDGGATWTKSRDLGTAVLAIAADPFDNGVLYARTDREVLRSEDGGASWQEGPENLGHVSSLVADPARPGRLYAATDSGVRRTVDGARTWHPFFAETQFFLARSLVISPDGKRLHAGTYGGNVFELDLTPVPSFPCVASTTRLCLLGDRFAVDLHVLGPGDDQYSPGAARPLTDRAGYFGLPFVTGDPDLPEVVVKMLAEGSFGTGGAPVFYSSLTTLPYSLTVTDTVTGEQQFYARDFYAFCGGVDAPFGQNESATERQTTPAAAGGTAVPLLGGRFSVTLEARDPHSGQAVSGVPMSSGDRFGFFSLPDLTGDPQFPEVVVKMIDARAIEGNFWFFYTGLTSLDYTLTVRDSVTGAVRTYVSTTPFCGGADTHAFTSSLNPVVLDLTGDAASPGGSLRDQGLFSPSSRRVRRGGPVSAHHGSSAASGGQGLRPAGAA